MKALYIMSSPRGGSTLIGLVLGRHPSIANLGEVSFIPKYMALGELCTCGKKLSDCEKWQPVFQKLGESTGVDMWCAPYDLHLDDVMKHKSGTGKIDFNHQTKWRVLRSKLRGALDIVILKLPVPLINIFGLPSIRAGAKNTLSLYQATADVWRKDAVVDTSKSPRKAIHLYKGSPECVRILHLTRDSRGVCTSRKSHMQLQSAVEKWKYYHSMALGLLAKWVPSEHRMRLKYEDFVSDPERYLRELCNWIEIPYSEKMLDFNEPVSEHSAGGNPTRFRFFSEGIRPVDERWRTELSDTDLECIERIGGDLSRKLGY